MENTMRVYFQRLTVAAILTLGFVLASVYPAIALGALMSTTMTLSAVSQGTTYTRSIVVKLTALVKELESKVTEMSLKSKMEMEISAAEAKTAVSKITAAVSEMERNHNKAMRNMKKELKALATRQQRAEQSAAVDKVEALCSAHVTSPAKAGGMSAKMRDPPSKSCDNASGGSAGGSSVNGTGKGPVNSRTRPMSPTAHSASESASFQKKAEAGGMSAKMRDPPSKSCGNACGGSAGGSSVNCTGKGPVSSPARPLPSTAHSASGTSSSQKKAKAGGMSAKMRDPPSKSCGNTSGGSAGGSSVNGTGKGPVNSRARPMSPTAHSVSGTSSSQKKKIHTQKRRVTNAFGSIAQTSPPKQHDANISLQPKVRTPKRSATVDAAELMRQTKVSRRR